MRMTTAARRHRAGTRGSSDNGTMVGVKEPREAVLAPLAVPMSLGAADGSACNALVAVGELAVIAALRCVYAG
jgi:hypothetical protein